MGDPIDSYYVVHRASEQDAISAVRALDAFLRTPGGGVRLDGPDRVVVWRHLSSLYVSPGALSLAGYLDPDPTRPRAAALCGPEMIPSRTYHGPAMTPSGTIAAGALPPDAELILGRL